MKTNKNHAEQNHADIMPLNHQKFNHKSTATSQSQGGSTSPEVNQ